jgi:hypothetical protein
MTDRTADSDGPNTLILQSSSDLQTLYRFIELLREDHRIRVVRGNRMRTWEALYAEMSAAFQFFTGFGWNLDALFECLTEPDLRFPHDSHLCLIVAAEQVLADEPRGELERFARCMKDAGTRERGAEERSGPATGPVFRTVIAPFENYTPTFLHWSQALPLMKEIRVHDTASALTSVISLMGE